MKIKVRNRVYDGNEEPIMVILTEQDKKNIKNMLPEATKYCMYPTDKISVTQIKKWMQKV